MKRMLLVVVGLVLVAGVVAAQQDLRSLGERRDSEILVRLSKENDLLRRQLQIVSARCP